MYRPNYVLIDEQRLSNIFNAQDNRWHDQAMKPIQGLRSMTKVLEVEPYVDETLEFLVAKLDKLFARDGTVYQAGPSRP
ncbi:hypothetical protein KC363_g5737 [Hortaea werneckii]|nr:hypothetical protein KC361_g4700 [Hortaea werneckii]KAI6883791.1 hypothetical protein KC325_g4822 [Hortaea werneckii]KAI6994168.1 hypothetical protein KC359_g4776 [Hortaea werneckii]KAI7145974.1 hypothetical protein KC344_g4049 [Hortaea werneckii]KAI7174779.1 hypothetical protein KC360_g4072 [Hortaea werneckii]